MRVWSWIVAVALVSSCVDQEAGGVSQGDGFDDVRDDGDSELVHVIHDFSDRDLYPEGGAFDPVDRAFYVGSLRHGNITRVAADGSESIFFAGEGGDDGRLTLGMQVDAPGRLLWVCTTKDSLGRIWIFDLATGARRVDIDLTTVQPTASCNDVLIDRDGTALVSDRENPFIYRVDVDGNAAVWATDPLLKGKIVSLNSLDFTPDHTAVLTATYLPPALIRVSVEDPRDVREVELSGARFMDSFNLLNGPDDLVIDDGELVVAFGSTLKRVTPTDASWSDAFVTSARTIGGVTALVKDGNQLYGINGQSVRFALHVPPAPFKIFEIGGE